MLTETLILALRGGAVGLLLADSAFQWLIAVAPANVPRLNEVGLNWRVVEVTLLLSVVTGILFGLAPAWHAARNRREHAAQRRDARHQRAKPSAQRAGGGAGRDHPDAVGGGGIADPQLLRDRSCGCRGQSPAPDDHAPRACGVQIPRPQRSADPVGPQYPARCLGPPGGKVRRDFHGRSVIGKSALHHAIRRTPTGDRQPGADR